MKRVIVTGANGLVGSAVLKELVKNQVEVLALCHRIPDNTIDDRLITYKKFELDKINDLDITKDYYDTCYHLAWSGSMGDDRGDIELQLKNVQWTIDVLNFAKKIGCSRFIGVGTITEFDALKTAYTDGSKPGISHIYGSAKSVTFAMAKSVAAKINIDFLWAIITNGYGIGDKTNRMLNNAIRTIIKKESPKFTSGTQNYDFVYIDDVARAFYLIGEKGKPFYSYLIGSGNARPLKEFLLEMKESIGKDVDFIFGDVPFNGVNLDLSVFDTKKTEEDTGFKAAVSFAEGTKKTYEWLKEVEK